MFTSPCGSLGGFDAIFFVACFTFSGAYGAGPCRLRGRVCGGVPFGGIDAHFVWQVWHLVKLVYGTPLGQVVLLVSCDAEGFCVAGLALYLVTQ